MTHKSAGSHFARPSIKSASAGGVRGACVCLCVCVLYMDSYVASFIDIGVASRRCAVKRV